MDYFTTGNEVVDQIGKLSISGDVIPVIWFETLLNDKGKPAYLSILILADLMYWHKPVEIRDERTGRVIGWKKKFAGEKLQRDYRDWAEKYGESERTIMRAIDLLISANAVRKYNCNVESENGRMINNVLFWEVVPETIYSLTYPTKESMRDIPSIKEQNVYRILSNQEIEERRNERKKGADTPYDKSVIRHMTNLSGAYGQICQEGGDKNDIRHMTNPSEASCQKCHEAYDNGGRGYIDTNTNGDKELIHPSIHSSITQSGVPELITERLDYRTLIRESIEYERLQKECGEPDRKSVLEDVYAILCEVIGIRHEELRINNGVYPYEQVRDRFLRIRYQHVSSVINRVMKEHDVVGNMHGYLMTALYNESYNR